MARVSRFVIAVAALVAIGGAGDALGQTPPVKLFIGLPTRSGFVEANKGVQDSIRDVRGRLRSIKGLALVAKPDEADLTLTIVDRGVGSEPYGQRLVYQEHYRGADMVSVPISVNTWWVAAILEVRGADYRKEFVGVYTHPPGLGYFGGAWRECGSRLVKDLRVWLEANREQLARRVSRP